MERAARRGAQRGPLRGLERLADGDRLRARARAARPRGRCRVRRESPREDVARARAPRGRRGGCLRRRSARHERVFFVGTGSSGTGSSLPARLVDVFRAAYPEVTGAYTCWNVAAGAQLTNHGSRIDYFLVDPDFARSVTRCGIARSHPGSDHCPVFIAVAAPTDVFRNAEDVETRARRVLPALVSSVALARAGRQARLTGFFRKSAPPAAAETYPRAAGVSVGAKRRGDVSIRSFFARKRARLLGKTTRAAARGTPVFGGKNVPPPRWRRRRKRRRGLLPRAPPAERLSGSIRRKRRRGLPPRAAPPLP